MATSSPQSLGSDGSVHILPSSQSNEQDVSFMNRELLLDILLRLPHTDDSKRQLFEYVQTFTNNSHQFYQNISQQFAGEYSANLAISWYTETSFLFREVNRALQELNVDFLYGIRHYLADLHHELRKLHLNFDCQEMVYRGAVIQNDMLVALEKKIGTLVCFGHFLSTSLDEAIARGFSTGATGSRNGVLFHIDVSSSNAPGSATETNPIASIGELSRRSYEKEVMMSPFCVFRIEKVEKKPAMKKCDVYYHVYLKLTSDRDQDLKNVYKYTKREIGLHDGHPSHMLHLAKVVRRMKKVDAAIKFYRAALEDPSIPLDESSKVIVYTDLALIYRQKQEYTNAMKELDKATKFVEQRNHSWYDRPYRIIMSNRGLVFKHQGNVENALQCYNRTVEMEKEASKKEAGDSFNQERATTLNNLGVLYCQSGAFGTAMAFFESTLAIQEKVLPANHWEIGRTYSNMSYCCTLSGQQREAEEFGGKAKRIKEKSLQSDHLSVAFTNKVLGFAQLRAGKLDEAYGTLDEAIEVFEKNYATDDPILQETKEARDSIKF